MTLTYRGLGKTTRLGNQMFYYSTLRSVGIKLGFPIKIPKRKMDLLYFNIQKDYLNSQDEITINKTYTEPSYAFSDKVFDVQDNTNLVGHFKSSLYFNSIRDILLKEFTLDQYKMNFIDSYIGKIRRENPGCQLIALHVRRGDYVQYPDVHPFCPMIYYNKCIGYFNSKYKCKYIIFSDDIPWCKQNFRFANNHFCELNNNLIELLLMARCDHNIIANSTFSWWGAYLNENPHKKIFYPDKWFGENSGTGNLLPESWTIVRF